MLNSLEKEKQMISDEYLQKMIKESHNLIMRFNNNPEPDNYGNCILFLHHSSQIEYTQLTQELIDRFYNVVKRYGESFLRLVENLKYESISERIETDRITGQIDIQKTMSIRQSGSKNVVCVSYTKNLFTSENILLGSIIIGIESLAEYFKERREEWDKNSVDQHRMKYLDQIIEFTKFVKKDRFISKLITYYYKNFNGIDLLRQRVQHRINYGKIKPDYFDLIKFLDIWKYWDKINSERSNLGIKVQHKLEELKMLPWELYELWLFYKIIDLYSKLEKMKQQNSPNNNIFSNGIYTIQRQWSKKIEWKIDGGNELSRRPDILIKKNGEIKAIIDAKYMEGNKELENNQGQTPDSKIVNQMIIAMDYGKTQVDLGIVLFADKDTKPVIIEKIGNNKKIHFRGMHPESNIESELEEIKKIID